MADNTDPLKDPFLKGSPITKLLGGTQRPHKVFRIAGRLEGTDLAVRSISVEEGEVAHADAMKRMTALGGWTREDFLNDVGEALFHQEMRLQVLARAMVDPQDPSKPFAASADELRRHLEADEVSAIFDEFSTFQKSRSPLREAKSLDEVREVADSLGKGLIAETSLQRYDAPTLRAIAIELAAWARTRTRLSSSPTSPPTDSSPD